jgi:hypothetical protein
MDTKNGDEEDVANLEEVRGKWPGGTRNEQTHPTFYAITEAKAVFLRTAPRRTDRPAERAMHCDPFLPLDLGPRSLRPGEGWQRVHLPFSRKYQTYPARFYPGSWCILDAREG